MTDEGIIIILESMKYVYPIDELDVLSNMALDTAIQALKERADLLERAYGHVVGQGTKGVIREEANNENNQM